MREKNLKQIKSMILLISFVFLFIVNLYQLITGHYFSEFCNLFLVITNFLLIIFLNKKILLGFVGVVSLYLFLSHLGIIFVDFFTPDLFESFKSYDMRWYGINTRELSVLLSASAINSLLLSAVITNIFQKKVVEINRFDLNKKGNHGLFLLSLILIYSFILYMVVSVLIGRIPLFSGYIAYYTALDSAPEYTYFIFLLSIGLTFYFANGNLVEIKKYSYLPIVTGLILISAGNRGEILYPLAAAFGVLLIRGYKLNLRTIMVILLTLFLIIPLIRDFRSTSIFEYDFTEMEIRWSDSIFEIGYTLRPLIYTVSWIENGEPLAKGKSYEIPILRQLSNFIPVIEKPEIRHNRYSFRDRLPTMGYSIVAESYFNFGKSGVIFTFFMLGFLISRSILSSSSFITLSFFGAFSSLILNHVRNAFAFIPGNLILITLCLLIGILLSLFIRGKIKL